MTQSEYSFCVIYTSYLYSLFRIREQSALLQAVRAAPTYSEIPASIRDYLEFNTKPSIAQTFDPLRTLTPTSNLPTPPVATSPHSHMFARMNSTPAATTAQPPPQVQQPTQQFNPIGRDIPSQKGVCVPFEIHFHLII